jgi:dTDP-4-amino-4,6-dideoxygalactose transaminase
MGRRLAPDTNPLPITEDAAGRLIRLPLFPGLEPAEQGKVIAAVKEFKS